MRQIDFNETHRRCQQFASIIETYPFFVVTLKSFDLNQHFPDRIALDLSNILNVKIVSICPQIRGHSDHIYDRLHRDFLPLSSQQINVNETPIHILWTGKQRLSALDTSSRWLPDRVVPLLPATPDFIVLIVATVRSPKVP
ncbi:unnamed protein product [Rotaria sordida]|uniref:Uncharacterized protein n=1 Tax=Rotaria sordida TaxID=392033 RepID=A0A818Z9I3_9BILA|nr:unnamed protein product [Rotaria sordida]CAF3804877.1 unnamed protein product [Rotaria sordida]